MSALAAPIIGDRYRVTAPATVNQPVPGPETFELIVDDYQRRLYGFALRMTGNREDADIAPAVDLGMRAIRVAIEEPPPVRSAADAIATSLSDVPQILRAWL